MGFRSATELEDVAREIEGVAYALQSLARLADHEGGERGYSAFTESLSLDLFRIADDLSSFEDKQLAQASPE